FWLRPIPTLFPYTTLFRSICLLAFINSFLRRFICILGTLSIFRRTCLTSDFAFCLLLLHFLHFFLHFFFHSSTIIFICLPKMFKYLKSTRLNSSHVSISYA